MIRPLLNSPRLPRQRRRLLLRNGFADREHPPGHAWAAGYVPVIALDLNKPLRNKPAERLKRFNADFQRYAETRKNAA